MKRNNDKLDGLLRNALRSTEIPNNELIQKIERKLMKEEDVLIKSNRKFSFSSARIAVIAAVAILSLSLVGFTYGNRIIQMLGGGRFVEGRDSHGNYFATMDSGFEHEPVEVRDGQIYFVLDGSNTNITEQCSEESYYQYETVDNNGFRHVLLIGGTTDNVGMAEYLWDQSGELRGSSATYKGETPAWLISAQKALKADSVNSFFGSP